jgi:acyl-ACP thioesterase
VTTVPRIEREYRVRFDEAAASGCLRSSGFLRFAQDMAWIHSESAGLGREWYESRGLTWLVRSIELEITSEAPYGSALTVSTEVVGFRRVWARRRSDFRQAGSDMVLATALTDWVLLNDRGVPVRPPDEILAAFPTPADGYSPLRLPATNGPADSTRLTSLMPRRADIDPMDHVNNAVYLDYLEEHLEAAGRLPDLRPSPRRYAGEFLDSARAGTALTGESWPTEDGYEFRLRRTDDRRELFRARATTLQPPKTRS